MPGKMVAYIRTAIEVAKALTQIHRLNISLVAVLYTMRAG